MRKKKEEAKQLSLGLRSPFSNYLALFNSKISDSFKIFELMKYAKDPVVWIINTINISLLALQAWILLQRIEDLPTKIPLVQYYNLDAMKLIERDFFISMPILSGALIIASILLSYKWFNREKILVKFLLYITLLSTMLLTYHLIKIVQSY